LYKHTHTHTHTHTHCILRTHICALEEVVRALGPIVFDAKGGAFVLHTHTHTHAHTNTHTYIIACCAHTQVVLWEIWEGH
jgi:hypothetical protein